MLTVMAMVGMKGSPGVKNASAYRFCGCLEMTRRMKSMESMRKININPKNEPLKPIASIKSMKKIHKYIRPTSLVTNMPEKKTPMKTFLLSQLKTHRSLL